MQRPCTSLLRHGIFKDYPPVLIRLGISNASNSVVVPHTHSCHYQYTSQQNSSDRTNGLNLQHEEELRRTCVQMIDQCQMMVKKLQLHCHRPNSKCYRKIYPRNTKNRDDQLKTIRNILEPQQTCITSHSEQKSSPATEYLKRIAQIDSIVDCSKVIDVSTLQIPALTKQEHVCNNAKVVEDENVPSFGPKVLQPCTAPALGTATSATATKANTSGRRSTRKCVHSARKCVSARNRPATQLLPQVKTECEHVATCPSRSTADSRDSTVALESFTFVNCAPPRTKAKSCEATAAVAAPTHCADIPPVCGVGDAVAAADGPRAALPLRDTPMQGRLRAESRAQACRAPPPTRSQAERTVDSICKCTISCLESLGRLPRILQPANLGQPCNAPNATQRCAKNSMPNLLTWKATKQPTHQTACEKFLRTYGVERERHTRVPPKVLADYEENISAKAIGSARAMSFSCAEAKAHRCKIRNGQYGNKSQQQIRHITTSCRNSYASSNDADSACSGKPKDNLTPKCEPKKRHPLCRPPPDVAPCVVADVSGPCPPPLPPTTAPPAKQTATKATENAKHDAKPDEKAQRTETFKSAGRCQKPVCQSSSFNSGVCAGELPTNACSAPVRPTNRLRYPPVPKHLLKRQSRCLRACMPKPGDPERRPLNNCERMLQDKANELDARPPDPMKQPHNKCVEMRRCKQNECEVLHTFPPPPRSDKDVPDAVLPYPKDLCGEPDPDAVPPWDLKCDDISEEEKCKSCRPASTRNTCGPVPPKPPPPPQHCAYNADDESFRCLTDADMAHPPYPDPVCPPMRPSTLKPQKVKYLDVLKEVPCAKRCMKCEERHDVDSYCDPCYRAKEVHAYSDTAYYDLHSYMAARRRMPPGPSRAHRRGKPFTDDDPPCN